MPTQLAKQVSLGLPETDATSKEPGWVRTRPSGFMLWLLALCSCETPNGGSSCTSDHFVCSWDSFPPIWLPFPASRKGLLLRLIVSCFVLPDSHLLGICCFLNMECSFGTWNGTAISWNGGWVDLGESRSGGVGGVDGGEIVVGMYYM